MTKPRILVTSAAGRTGSAAVLQLLEKGFPIRAASKQQLHLLSDNKRSSQLSHAAIA